MLSDSVDQKPIMPVSDGMKTGQKSARPWNFDGSSTTGPNPPARATAHTSSTSAITSTIGAAQFSNTLTAFMPR